MLFCALFLSIFLLQFPNSLIPFSIDGLRKSIFAKCVTMWNKIPRFSGKKNLHLHCVTVFITLASRWKTRPTCFYQSLAMCTHTHIKSSLRFLFLSFCLVIVLSFFLLRVRGGFFFLHAVDCFIQIQFGNEIANAF